jgi:hypothetical protein
VTPEERLTKLEEVMLVNASLMNRIEQNMDRLQQKVDAQQDDIAELRAFQSAVLERLDRFIQGREGNGRK